MTNAFDTPLPEAVERFDRAVDRWFRRSLELSPETATRVGIHDRDAELSSGSRDAVDEEIELRRATIAEMEAFRREDLGADRALDRDLLVHHARLALFELEEYRYWSGHSSAGDFIGEALFPLFIRDFAPLRERLASIAGRLEAAPRFIEEVRERVTDPVPLWIELDLETLEMLPDFLDTILAGARSETRDDALAARLDAAVGGAKRALADHAAVLRQTVLPGATRAWHAGPERLERLVALRELDADGDEILAVGEEMLRSSTEERLAICAEVDPLLTPEEVHDLVKNDHAATFPEALEEYRGAMDRARRFVVEHELATFPPNDRLIVIETPSFVRHVIPFAAYDPPAKFDADPVGVYLVTPPSTPGMMREHSRASISNTGVHEAYPGHHLQLSAAITNSSLARTLSFSPEFDEGWAFYCERMMKEAGFDDTPTHRYIQLTDAIWRAARIVLDVRLHRGEIDFEEAVDFLVAHTGFERPAALAEVKRYTYTPTYQLSYQYGRHLIERLRTDVERRMGGAFSLRFFHDTLLYGGSMPVSYARRLFDARLTPDGVAA